MKRPTSKQSTSAASMVAGPRPEEAKFSCMSASISRVKGLALEGDFFPNVRGRCILWWVPGPLRCWVGTPCGSREGGLQTNQGTGPPIGCTACWFLPWSGGAVSSPPPNSRRCAHMVSVTSLGVEGCFLRCSRLPIA